MHFPLPCFSTTFLHKRKVEGICALKDHKMSSLRSNHDGFHLGWKKYLHLWNPYYNKFGSQDWIHCTNLSCLEEGSFFLEGNLRPASSHLWDVLCWVLIISCCLIYLPHNVAWLWTWARQISIFYDGDLWSIRLVSGAYVYVQSNQPNFLVNIVAC